MGYLDDMSWYPDESIENYYANFKNTYGFEQYYDRGYPIDEEQVFLNAMLDINKVIDVEDFDVFFRINIYNNNKTPVEIGSFNLNEKAYKIMQQSDENGNLTLLFNYEENTTMEIPMMEFIDGLFKKANEPKAMMAKENLKIQKQNEKIKIKFLINSLYVD